MYPDDLLYTTEYEWVRLEEGEITVGITEYTQTALGYIVFVKLPLLGQKLN